jgi:predicted AlkP superfamily pyrophosphatase or phosphodiesterase
MRARLLRLLLVPALLVALLPARGAPPPLVLVSIDGFHPEYVARGHSPTLHRLANAGTHARRMLPAFPSLTFPNHYTQVTGLDPDQHGIVHNTMVDPGLADEFSLSNRAAVGDGRWWGGVPVWVSAERAGLRTAPLFWPGSEAEIAGVRPHLWRPYDQRMLPGARVDEVLAWLDRPPSERPAFMTLYFDLVDTVGHAEGPRSTRLDAALAAIDRALARLVDGLAARGMLDAVNLVLVSDHGMAATSPQRVVRLDAIVDRKDVVVRYWGTVVPVEPAAGRAATVARALVGRHRGMRCWRKQDLPTRFRYGRHQRVAPFVCLADPGWLIADAGWIERNRDWRGGGAHGYDNAAPSMRALFVAHGPAFRRATVVDEIEARDVYGVLMGALSLPPETPLASPDRVAAVLAPPAVALARDGGQPPVRLRRGCRVDRAGMRAPVPAAARHGGCRPHAADAMPASAPSTDR